MCEVVTMCVNSKGFEFPGNAADDEARPTAIKIDAFDDFIEGEDRSVREFFKESLYQIR
jgi:hypothetical protein